MNIDDFSDMDDLDSAPTRPETASQRAAREAAPTIACPKCAGTGQFTFGYAYRRTEACLMCKGTGQVRADWQKRREAFRKGEATKVANRANREVQWRLTHPAQAEWLQKSADRGFGFAQSLLEAIKQYGHLTERQMAKVEELMARDAERQQERAAERKANEVQVANANGIIEALTKATREGHKAPKLRTEVATFSMAKAGSVNAGCVYAKAGELYLGKITPAGVFQPSRDCTAEQKAEIAKIAENALEAAVEYGKRTGRCSCCGRELTDPVSIAAGIGPICAAGFF